MKFHAKIKFFLALFFLHNCGEIAHTKSIKIYFYDVFATHIHDEKASDPMMALFGRLKKIDRNLLGKIFIGTADMPEVFKKLTAEVSRSAPNPLSPADRADSLQNFAAEDEVEEISPRDDVSDDAPDEAHLLRRFMSDQSFFWDNIQPNEFMVSVIRQIKATGLHTLCLHIVCTADWKDKKYPVFYDTNKTIMGLFDKIIITDHNYLNHGIIPGSSEARDLYDITLRPVYYGDGSIIERNAKFLDMLVKHGWIHREQAVALRENYFPTQALQSELGFDVESVEGYPPGVLNIPDHFRGLPAAAPAAPVPAGAPAAPGHMVGGAHAVVVTHTSDDPIGTGSESQSYNNNNTSSSCCIIL